LKAKRGRAWVRRKCKKIDLQGLCPRHPDHGKIREGIRLSRRHLRHSDAENKHCNCESSIHIPSPSVSGGNCGSISPPAISPSHLNNGTHIDLGTTPKSSGKSQEFIRRCIENEAKDLYEFGQFGTRWKSINSLTGELQQLARRRLS